MIPRENRIVRFYVQLLNPNTDLDVPAVKASYTIDSILKRAQRIFSPYELTYDYCDWWSVYQVGQRLSKHYSLHNRLFLAGDAVRKQFSDPRIAPLSVWSCFEKFRETIRDY